MYISSISAVKVRMESFRCNICDMSFRTLGKLSGEKRLFHIGEQTTEHPALTVESCLFHTRTHQYINSSVMM